MLAAGARRPAEQLAEAILPSPARDVDVHLIVGRYMGAPPSYLDTRRGGSRLELDSRRMLAVALVGGGQHDRDREGRDRARLAGIGFALIAVPTLTLNCLGRQG